MVMSGWFSAYQSFGRNYQAGCPTAPHLAGMGQKTANTDVREEPRLAEKIDEGVPAHVLSAALYDRFTSRGEAEFANKLLSAMRYEFGGHIEKPTG
jgi:6-phosphogluconate dehydrogenase (decarboxylating)